MPGFRITGHNRHRVKPVPDRVCQASRTARGRQTPLERPRMTNPQPATTPRDALALTPPMGWNSWNTFRCYDLNETVVRETAEAMVASGMRDAGYEYVVIDDCWQDFRRGPDGRLRANPERFGSGMAALGEHIHSLGLKFGMYASPGRQTCAMIYDRYPGTELGSFAGPGHWNDPDMLEGATRDSPRSNRAVT